jgi:iron complex outermembrane receptor protein
MTRPGRWSALAVPLWLSAAAAAPGQSSPAPQLTLFEDEAISVTVATRSEIELRRAPGSVDVLTAREIRESGARTVPELLRLLPGVHVRWNPMVQTIDVRGFGENPFTSRVLLLIDGIPYNSWEKGGFVPHPSLDFFEPQNIKRIELVRGPGSALYGENAFWGVINIVTLGGEDLRGGAVELHAGDRDTRSARVAFGDKLRGGTLFGSLRRLDTRYPLEFWLENGGGETRVESAFLKAEWRGVRASWYAYRDTLDGFDERFELPGLPFPLHFASAREIGQRVDIAALQYDTPPGATGRVRFGSTVSSARREGSHCGACHAVGERSDFRSTGEDHGSQLFADARVGIALRAGHELLLGAEVRELELGEHREELLDPDAAGLPGSLSYSKPAAYVQDQISLFDDRLRITAGVRWDGSADTFDSRLSPRLSVVAAPAERVVARLSWGTAYRPPTFSERYQDTGFFHGAAGPLVLTFARFRPSPALEPEEVESLEAGLDWRPRPALAASLRLFRSELDDFLVFVPTFLPDGSVDLAYENHPDRATLTGGEVELRWQPRAGLRQTLSWSFLDHAQEGGRTDSAGTPIEFVYSPRHALHSTSVLGPWRGLSATLEATWTDEVVAPRLWYLVRSGFTDPTVRPLPDVLLVDLKLTWQVELGRGAAERPLRLSLAGRNLLDERPEQTLLGSPNRIAGREYFATAAWEFR